MTFTYQQTHKAKMKIINHFVCGWLLLVSISFTGCAVHQPIDVGLTPETSSTGLLQVDGKKELTLSVFDERPTKKIGMRGAGNMGGEINVKGDVPTLIKEVIQKPLENGKKKEEDKKDN